MAIIKLFVVFFIATTINASVLDKIIFVENKDRVDQVSLKDEFLNDDTKAYTVSIAVLNSETHSPIEYFKKYKMQDALAYKFGDDLKYTRLISGVYTRYSDAQEAIKKLDKRLILNKPYAIKVKAHQEQFKKYNNIGTTPAVPPKVVKKANIFKDTSNDDAIYISGSELSQSLKDELLKNGSKLYAISIATVPSSKSKIDSYFKENNIEDKALAHKFGKSRKNSRVIYGLYPSYKEAQEAISKLNSNLRANKPYAMKMKHFQSYFRKYNPNYNQEIIQLKIKKPEKKERVAGKTKLNENLKIITPSKQAFKNKIEDMKNLPTKRFVKKEEPKKPKKIEPKKVEPKVKKVEKKQKIRVPKKVKKIDKNKNRFLKHSVVEDIYYIESDGNFNILNEVFLNDKSSFYTIDLGEILLSEDSIEQFFIRNGMNDNALAYKYGDKKEFARAIYGAYESKDAAQEVIEELDIKDKKLKVSNIKNHQKLFKMYHENILKSAPKNERKQKKKETYKAEVSQNDIVYTSNDGENRLKDEFFSENSPLYTITLITFHKNDLTPEEFILESGLKGDALAFSLGSSNKYYRVIYGAFKSSKEALKVIDSLDNELLKNKPYVSKVRTTKRRFESYNNRDVNDYKNKALKIEIE